MAWRKQQIDRAINSALDEADRNDEQDTKNVPYRAAKIMQLRAGRATDDALRAVQEQWKKRR